MQMDAEGVGMPALLAMRCCAGVHMCAPQLGVTGLAPGCPEAFGDCCCISMGSRMAFTCRPCQASSALAQDPLAGATPPPSVACTLPGVARISFMAWKHNTPAARALRLTAWWQG